MMAAATAYHLPRPTSGPSTLYPRGGLADLDFKDTRYPMLGASSTNNRRGSAVPNGLHDLSGWDNTNEAARKDNSDRPGLNGRSETDTKEREEESGSQEQSQPGIINGMAPGVQQAQPSKLESVVQYALPTDTTRRVVERYSMGENRDDILSPESDRPFLQDSPLQDSPQDESITASQHQQGIGRAISPERPISILPASPRHPSLLPAPGAGPSNRESTYTPVGPSSASPLYNSTAVAGLAAVPLSSNPRAYAHQPTYVTPSSAPNPLQPVYLPNPPPLQEEVCVECAMRDQDMADVDVTGPGVWERESDALYDDLVRREQEEEQEDVISNESYKSNRPRAKGGRLSESNLKVWLTMNPREPQARQQTLQLYLRTQRALLEAETLAHARAMQESRQLDSRMRDTYSQLRRSQYDIGSSGASPDETGGVRIRSPSGMSGLGPHGHSHSREVTLLENGLIVEQVNVRKEEREERERRRKEEKRERSRARKSSRSSVYSVRSLATPVTDSGLGLQPHTRYSAPNVTRPTSITTTYDRPPSFPRAYSQASFSDVHSLGSGSPRQRFFGFRNLSSGWRSRDSLAPSGMSGSMVDMHVALQREGYEQRVQSPIDLASNAPSLQQNQAWRTEEPSQMTLEEVPKKKKKGLAKIWNTLTGSKSKGSQAGSFNDQAQSFDKTDDDLPLAPPPPLSYLVERGPGEHNTPVPRQSTISLPSTASPKNVLSSPAVSPGTPPSSLLPSPASSRPSNADPEIVGEKKTLNWNQDEEERADPLAEEGSKLLASPKSLHQITSEPDIRQSQLESPSSPSNLAVPQPVPTIRPASMLLREKSLPPLPHEINLHPPADQPDSQPRTVYPYDHSQIPAGASPPVQDFSAPRAPYHTEDARRQSFGGITSQHNYTAQTLPSRGMYTQELKAPATSYNEFGGSRRSLGYMEHIQEKQHTIPYTPSKRKSKFGLATLLGRKSQVYDRDLLASQDSPVSRRSTSDARDDVTYNGSFATSGSRHSVTPRMSVISRKVEALVEQDPTFVAYRYPSSDQQTVDLLR